MARDRSIVVRLKAEVSDFQRQMGSASRTLSDFEREQQNMGGAATTTMGKLAQHAKINRQEWDTVGRALVTTGAAVTAMGGAALKVGIDYNSLRQNATQSLTAVTGSTEEASAAMARLDEWGATSWLMRDTLVRAQQQMTGFGIETDKVIPYMDGLAEAVAAAGGSNQDFEELAMVMGQVQSQGKLTARELDQFGRRGIDAATLIGESMGKTGDQIRSEITAGTLDAEVALDALADGMKTRYDGASELVRDSFSGAFDNVKAAFRDLMAEIAAPLVDPEGGGLLVGLMNKVEDFLSMINELPGPVKTGGAAIAGLGGVAALAGGSFLLLAPRVFDVVESMKRMAVTAPDAAAGMKRFGRSAGPIGLAVTAAAIATAGMGKAVDSLHDKMNERHFETHDITEYEAALIDMAKGAATAGEAMDGFFSVEASTWNVPWEQHRSGIDGLGDAMDRVANKSMEDKVTGMFSWVPGIDDVEFQYAEDGINEIDAALAGMVDGGNIEDAEAAWAELKREAEEQGLSVEQLTELFPEYQAALQGTENQAELTSGASEELAAAMAEVTEAMGTQAERASELTDALHNQAGIVLDVREAERKWIETLKEANSQAAESTEGLNNNTQEGRDNERMIDDLTKAGWDRIESMRQTNASESELQKAMADTRKSVIDARMAFGDSRQEAERYADQLGLIPDNIHTDVTAATDRAEANIQAFLNKWSGKTIDTYVRLKASSTAGATHPAAQADGSVRLRSFADGGYSSLPKQAVIQAATPGLIQWAEPETKGEAFIPLAASKRRRSLAIWEETGRHLGALPRSFANGALLNAPPPSPSYSSVSQVAGHTINVYGVTADSTSEVAKAVLFASRKQERGGVYSR